MSDPSDTGNGSPGAIVPVTVEASLQPIIKDLPEPKQREIVQTFEKEFPLCQ